MMPHYTNILDRPLAASLLMFILKEEKIRSGRLYDLDPDYIKMVNLAREMEALGLVNAERSQRPVFVQYSLTEAGKGVARDLEAATNKIYSGSNGSVCGRCGSVVPPRT
jgi:hypothetical protein